MYRCLDVRLHVARANRTIGVLLAALVSCVTPAPVELELEAAQVSLDARRDGLALEEALALVPLQPSFLVLPEPDRRAHPTQAGFWLVRALAFAPEVRAARRDYRAARALRSSAGAPEPIFLQAVDHQFGGDDPLVEGVAALDLIGLLGLGPSRADRGVASAEEALRLGALERTAWQAWLAVERARIARASSEERLHQLESLLGEVTEDLPRIEILERNDRLSEAAASVARGAVDEVRRRFFEAQEHCAATRAQLARASGLSFDDPALDGAGLAWLSALPGPRGEDWSLEQHPRLREALMVFALREAEVRRAAAAAWPALAVGPHLGYIDEYRLGGVLRLRLPFPSSWRGRLQASVERRDAAIEAYEDALQDLLTERREARSRHAATRDRVAPSRAVRAAAEQLWTASRASFRTGRAEVEAWTHALERHLSSTHLTVNAEEAQARAALDVIASEGPWASPFAPSMQAMAAVPSPRTGGAQ